jgi:hypothetical protein
MQLYLHFDSLDVQFDSSQNVCTAVTEPPVYVDICRE